ncbi:MAG: FMN-binding protein [Ruminococcaceae bacterium]|nr:FMN-binding protein [Oscillospiraceae bacterium]
MKLIKTILILLVICTIFGAAMFGIDMYTGPIIENNKLGAIKDRLNKVMPDAASYEEITDQLNNIPENVTAVYEETTGKGYVVLCTAESQYSASPMDITLGVAADGKICGIQLDSYTDSVDFRDNDANYLNSYIGKDSALADVGTVSGATFSSSAFKGSVEAAMGVLIENDLIKAGEKTPEQILTELIATVYPEMAPEGTLNAEKMTVSGTITTAYKSTNNTGYAYIFVGESESYLVIITPKNTCTVYDVDGKDVTEANTALVGEAVAHMESSKLEILNAVMPNGSAYKEITATLDGISKRIIAVYRETSGLGYVLRCQAESDYSSAPMEITIGVDMEGKICGIQIDSYNDTASFDFREKDPNYLPSYIGKDSALADIGIVAGSTFSSTAFKNAVSEAMGMLIENDLIAAGVKSDAQILEELIPTVAPGFTKLVEGAASGNIQKALKAENDTGFAYIMIEGDATYLAVVNATGVCKVYNVEGADVTADHAALADEAKAASAAQISYSDALITKIGNMMDGASDITALEIDTFNTVVAAVSFKIDGVNYYGFYSRSIGFHQMDVYIVIDENGAIAKIDAKQFIFDEEYFMSFGGMNVGEYKNGFVGITGETWNGDAAIIATATMTSNAMKESTTDAFASFNSIKGGAK